MYGVRAEGGQAHRDVTCAFGPRRAVAHPLTRSREHGLPGRDLEHRVSAFDLQQALEHQRVLVELWGLPGLLPTGRRPHLSDAEPLFSVVHASDVLVDELWLVTGCGDATRFGDQRRHEHAF